MNQTPTEVRTANLIYLAFWVVLVLAILLFGDRWDRTRDFRRRMMAQWRPALVIAALFVISMGIAGRGFLNLHGITLFCQALIGLALARGIAGFEPLPVTEAVVHKHQAWKSLLLMVIIAVVMVVPAQLIGTIGLDIANKYSMRRITQPRPPGPSRPVNGRPSSCCWRALVSPKRRPFVWFYFPSFGG